LGEKDGLTQREIVEEIKIKPSTVTLILKRMEKRGLILKKKDEKDRRYSRIYLTDSGRKILCNLKKVFDKLEEECFSGFSDKEKEILRNFFIRIRDNLRSINKGEKI
jgi:DNA-binding MarR family transcriptional regulator